MWIAGAAVPAHRLHNVEKHRSGQIRAEVDEHGENDHSQAESLFVVFLQHGCTVPTPWTSQRHKSGQFKLEDNLILRQI